MRAISRVAIATWAGTGWSGTGLTRSTLELVTAARQVSGGEAVTLIALGAGAADAAAAAGGLGLDRALIAEGADPVGSDAYVAALAEAISAHELTACLVPSDVRGREVAARVATRLGGVCINEVAGVEPGQPPLWRRPTFGGRALATVVARRGPVLATARSRAFAPAAADGDPAPAASELTFSSPQPRQRSLELIPTVESGPRIEDAKVVVAGGRGLGSKELFDQLEELAALLNGSVGASLAAVDEGWAGPERQVGLTGKTVSPELYLAIGISGASQHLAGLAGVKHVVAVNSDPGAPIFGASHLGAVLDAREAVPGLIAEIRRLGSQ